MEIAKATKDLGVPIHLIWTREDDITGGYYRPAFSHQVHAGLDAQGQPIAWDHRSVGQSIAAGTFMESMVKNGVDPLSVEGISDLAYKVPNLHVELHSPRPPQTVLWWRSVGHSHTAFAVESAIDELASLAGRDPLAYRLGLLADKPRHRAVLELAAAKADWSTPMPKGRGRGIAVHESFKSYVAQVVEVTMTQDGFTVDRVVCAVDCGIAVNPDNIAAQMEGGIGFALSAALYGEITMAEGRIEQTNFHNYQLLRFNEMPRIEVHIVPSTEHPTGVGEPGVPPVAPALCNAIAAASGKRHRSLPLRRV